MITLVPVVITVGFIGYLVAGFPGANSCCISNLLTSYLFTIIPPPYFKTHSKHPSIKAFVDGITAAVVGALAGAVIVITIRTIVDIPTALIALATIIIYFNQSRLPDTSSIVTLTKTKFFARLN